MITQFTKAQCTGRLTYLSRHRQVFTQFLRNSAVVCVGTLFLLLVSLLHASNEPDRTKIGLAYLNLTTARAPQETGATAEFVGGVVVRVYRKDGRETFGITDQYGVALMPLRPGSYCADAYGTNGAKLRLEPRNGKAKSVCFEVGVDQTKDVGLMLAKDQQYEPDQTPKPLQDPPTH